jgi:hypothetical protein
MLHNVERQLCFQQVLTISFFDQRSFISSNQHCVVPSEPVGVGINERKVDEVVLALNIPGHAIADADHIKFLAADTSNILHDKALSREFLCHGFFEDESGPNLKTLLKVERLRAPMVEEAT